MSILRRIFQSSADAGLNFLSELKYTLAGLFWSTKSTLILDIQFFLVRMPAVGYYLYRATVVRGVLLYNKTTSFILIYHWLDLCDYLGTFGGTIQLLNDIYNHELRWTNVVTNLTQLAHANSQVIQENLHMSFNTLN